MTKWMTVVHDRAANHRDIAAPGATRKAYEPEEIYGLPYFDFNIYMVDEQVAHDTGGKGEEVAPADEVPAVTDSRKAPASTRPG